ncbi:autotransporter outer membrane beta-barrel domain-containing protein [Xenorhabdus sp. PB30.3]|nr:autotransporter outer membrane beta-barrel domain-containing protein [Xenorhabdus sp. PB30.3]
MYRYAILSITIRLSLFFSGINISVNVIAATKCGTPDTVTTIPDKDIETEPCNLAESENLIIEKGASIKIPEYNPTGNYGLNSSAVNIGRDNNHPPIISVEQIKNNGTLNGSSGVIVTYNGYLGKLDNDGNITGTNGAVWVSGHLEKLNNSGSIKSSSDAYGFQSIWIANAQGHDNPGKYGRVGTITNQKKGLIEGISVGDARLGILDNYGKLTGLNENIGSFTNALIIAGDTEITNNYGTITSIGYGVYIQSGGNLKNLNNYNYDADSKGIIADQDAIHVTGQGSPYENKLRASKIGQITNNSMIYGKQNGIFIGDKGIIDIIANEVGGEIKGDKFAINNSSTITNGIHNSGSIVGNVKLGNASLYMSGSKAILNGNVTGSKDSVVTIGNKDSPAESLDLTFTHDMNVGIVKILSGNALRLGDGHKTGSISNNIDNKGSLYFNSSDKSIYDHTISGTGPIHQIGSGTTILTNTNTYMGETNIESGTLQLGNKGTTGSIDNTAKVVIGQKGILAFDHSVNVTFGSNIEGEGSLRQQGSGDLTLTGNITTAKPINVATGKLRFGDGTTIGKLSLAGIENQGAVTVSGADDSEVMLDGEIIGTGTLDITGGKAILTGDNPYSGLTTIGHGAILQLGNGGTTGNLIRSNILNNGTLTFHHTNNMIYSNVISGEGGIEQTGTGITILNSQNTYTGTTRIKAGTLQFDTWNSMPGKRSVEVGADSTLVLNLNGVNRFDGVISGRGHLEKMGTGVTTLLSDSSAFTGSTHVEGGAFVVDGQLGTTASTFHVKDGGTVSGAGVIGGTTTIENGGHLTSTQGTTLTVGNDLILNEDANVDIALGAQETSAPTLFNIRRNLTLAGTLNVTDLGGFAAGEYDIFHYGGALTNKGMTFTSGEPGALYLDTRRDKTVYLINTGGMALNYWDGGNASKHNNGVINGGNGVWQVGGPDNWTSVIGKPNTGWLNTDQFAIFSGAAGTIQVDNRGGNVTVKGMQFSTEGYTITGSPLTLENDKTGSAKIRVGTGKKSTEGSVATIKVPLIGSATLETTDYGTLVLTGENNYTGNTKVTRGTLQIGNGGTHGSITSHVVTGSEGTLLFNRADNVTFGGNIEGKGKLVQNGKSTLALAGANSYTGTTEVRKGTLRQGTKGAFSTASSYIVGQHGTLDMGEFNTTLSALNNSGNVLFGREGNTTGRTLTISGNYHGNDGTVNLSTVLEGDNSKTDRLVVKGNTSGTTHLTIKNVGGTGAPTKEGIKIVDVKGASDGTFNLVGDYHYRGVPTVVGGAYAYRLYKNGTDNSDGNWYLRSSLTNPTPTPEPKPKPNPKPKPKPKPERLYQAGVSVYEIYGRVLQTLNTPESLRNRFGNSEAKLQDMGHLRTTAENADNIPDGIWEQITVSHGKLSPHITTSETDNITYNMVRAQIGVDKRFYESGQGAVNGGFFLQYANIDANAGSVHGEGNIRANGYTLGITSTWRDNNGLYLDGLAQLTYFHNDLHSKTANQSLGNGKSALGYALSLEAGQQINLTPVWSLTPQAQLVYSSINMKDFDDRFGARIHFDQSRILKLRVGATIDYNQKWSDKQSKNEKSSNLYGLFNLRQEILGRNDVVDVVNVPFHGRDDLTWGETGVGGSYSWDNRNSFIYGQTSINTSLNNFADSYELSAKIGIKVMW